MPENLNTLKEAWDEAAKWILVQDANRYPKNPAPEWQPSPKDVYSLWSPDNPQQFHFALMILGVGF